MLEAVLKALARLPLGWFHACGALLGRVVYWSSPVYAARLKENLLASGVCTGRECEALLGAAVTEAGKGVTELVVIWFRDAGEVAALVRERRGWEHVEAALSRGKGVIFLTPHLGCFEISALYAAQHFPITVLYRPPKLKWLEPLMVAGRSRGRLKLAATDLRGVRALYRALKKGEAVGMLPDQAPAQGEGVWAGFFGRPAYTMTLVARLAQTSGAPVLTAFAERLPKGAGYRLCIDPLPPLPQDPQQAAETLNRAVEALVRRCPQQYLWSYNRYKVPAGVAPPGEAS